MGKGNGRRGGELASASLSAILRGGGDDGPQRLRVPPRRPPTPIPMERRHHRRTQCRSSITNGVGPCCRGRQDYGRNVFYSVSRRYSHQSRVCIPGESCWMATVTSPAGVADAAAVTADPANPTKTLAKTASASRLARVVSKMTPFTWLATSLSSTNSPVG